jgi:hypothetical protein
MMYYIYYNYGESYYLERRLLFLHQSFLACHPQPNEPTTVINIK